MSRVVYRFFLVGILAVTMFSSGVIMFFSPVPNQPFTSSSSTAFATFPAENGKIAFGRGGDIYVMNADGSGQTRLTDNGAFDGYPDWSPDGTKIAFESKRDGNSEIYVMNADGSGQTNISNNPAYDFSPTWSPDNTKIAFVSNIDGTGGIYVMNSDGSNTRLLKYDDTISEPDWSPDGTKIAFTKSARSYGDIFVMNADGTGLQKLTEGTGSPNDRDPSWSPDGTKIAFASDRARPHSQYDQDYNNDIYIMTKDGYVSNADDGNPLRLTIDPAVDTKPSWSPDGTKIAFTRRVDFSTFQIYVMNADGTGQTNISNNPASDTFPDWGPATSTEPEQDTTPPALTVPPDITEEATTPEGATVSFEVSAQDDVDGPTDVDCDHNSGETFPIGETVVTCNAEDLAGNHAEESFTITIQDTTAPDVEITEASDRRRNAEIPDGGTTPINYIRITFEATDAVDIEKTECSLDEQPFSPCTSPVVYDRLSRSTHEFTVRVTDAAGNTGEDQFTWTVRNPSAAAPGRQ